MIVQKELFGEGKHVEFKAEIPKKHEKFLKDIIAFANTSGGKTILGVDDTTGEAIGLGDKNPFRLSDDISSMISAACAPQINMEITAKTMDGKTILEIEVFPGRYRPYYLKSVGKEKSTYIRVNGTSRPADERKIKELELEGRRLSYDTMPEIGACYDEEKVKALMQEMYQIALDACRSESEREDVRPLTIQKLEDFGILCKEGKEYMPTHAFTLLTHPTDRNVKIQCALFKGTVRDEFIDKKEFYGPLHQQVDEAYRFVLRHINRSAVIEGLYRRDSYELPTKSIREIIANACLHRSYLDSSSIQVSIYDDRLEVDSPGMLYDGLSVTEALSGKSKCRNTAIAEAFQYMKIIEGWGTGLPRLFRQCKEMGLPTPTFEEAGDGIKVTVYRASDANNESNPESKGMPVESKVDSGESKAESKDVTVGSTESKIESKGTTVESKVESNLRDNEYIQAQILRLIADNPEISQRSLSKEIGVARSTIQRHLAKLIKEGKVQRQGRTHGSWVICEKH